MDAPASRGAGQETGRVQQTELCHRLGRTHDGNPKGGEGLNRAWLLPAVHEPPWPISRLRLRAGLPLPPIPVIGCLLDRAATLIGSSACHRRRRRRCRCRGTDGWGVAACACWRWRRTLADRQERITESVDVSLPRG